MPIQTFNPFPRPIPETGIPQIIKSIQQGIISGPPSTSASFSISISTVDLKSSVVFLSMIDGPTSTATVVLFNAELTDANHITFTRVTSASQQATLIWTVIEFNSLKSFQKGTASISPSNTTTAIPISPVNTSKSLIYFSFNNNDSTSSNGVRPAFGGLMFTANNQLTFQNSFNNGFKTVIWYVVEFF